MKCEVCGNDYDKAFELIRGGQSHVFDSMDRVNSQAPVGAVRREPRGGHGRLRDR